jgi:RNA polymerase sigma-70 factor (ECF subfamily)
MDGAMTADEQRALVSAAAGAADAADVDDATDEDLATRFGDRAAFSELYRRYRAKVYRLVRRYVGSDDDAADLVGESFERAFASITDFDRRRGRFAAWLLGIAHNAAVDALRRRSRTIRLVDRLPLGETDRLDDIGLPLEAAVTLRAALASLSLVEQAALAMRFGAGLTAAEIASVIGKHVSATEKLLTRAVAKLRKELSDAEN